MAEGIKSTWTKSHVQELASWNGVLCIIQKVLEHFAVLLNLLLTITTNNEHTADEDTSDSSVMATGWATRIQFPEEILLFATTLESDIGPTQTLTKLVHVNIKISHSWIKNLEVITQRKRQNCYVVAFDFSFFKHPSKYSNLPNG